MPLTCNSASCPSMNCSIPAQSCLHATLMLASLHGTETGHTSPAPIQCPSRCVQVSFGTILSPLGLGLMVYGFCAYFSLLPGGDVSSLLLIYGFPLTLLGFALSYAQLPPVPCRSMPSAVAARESQATDIQKQVWSPG